jgi:hypothetical protein
MSTLATTNLKHASSASNNVVLDSSGNTTLATAKITTLADSAGANTSTPAEIASGRAKAWVNFDGTGTVAIRASYNVSSITDVGTGTYTINFTNALADANYAWVGSRGGQGGTLLRDDSATYITSSSIQIETRNTAGSLTDYNYIFSAVFR